MRCRVFVCRASVQSDLSAGVPDSRAPVLPRVHADSSRPLSDHAGRNQVIRRQHPQMVLVSSPRFSCLSSACCIRSQQAVREAATICPRPCKLTFDLLTLKVGSESRVTWATSVPILICLWPLCSRLRPDVRDRQTDVRRQTRIIA